jgi:hypothetical protein
MDHAVEHRRVTGGEPVVVRPVLRRWLALLLAGVAAAVLLSWVLLAVVHVDDRYLVNAGFLESALQGGNSSVWMVQASAGQDSPYPPLYDGRSYGGSRYAPLPLLAWTAAASLTGDYLVAGKLLTYLVAVSLLGLALAVTRRLSRSTAVALLLTSSILVAIPGLVATASTPRGDAMALLFQLLAVVLVDRSSDGRACAGAGALCALAVFSKLSAVWGPLAIVVWLLLRRDRRRLPLFLGVFVVLSLALFGAAQLLSDGRMLTNFQATLFADTGAGSAIAPLRLLQLLAQAAPATALLLPFSLLADGGAQANHLIDVVVLVPVVVGDLWSRVAVGLSELSLLAVAVGLVAVWAVVLGYGLNLQHDVREAAASALGRGGGQQYDAEPLRGYVDDGDAVLSEDPYVPLSIGQRPVVLDPWMLAILGRRHPGWVTDLARRVDAQEFDDVVLAQRLETAPDHYRRTIFGEPVMSAVCRHYRFAAQVRGYWLYVPAEPKESLARADTQGPNNCSPRG